VEGVSAREAEVLDLLGSHLTNAEIARRLFISVRTVESHVSSLLRKVGVADRRALADHAARRRPAEPAADEDGPSRVSGFSSRIPEPATTLVGREDDLRLLQQLVGDHRIVTITGPGGVGKTRALIGLGRLLAPEFGDAVAFVALAHVTDPTDVIATLADVLDVKEAEERTLAEGLRSLIGDKNVLLLLDNLEQVVGSGSDIAALVEQCPRLHVVATSRMPLRVVREHEFQLAPLALPGASSREPAESLLAYPALAVFVERARAARGTFELTAANADAVVAVCRRLDGLPLALELAAPRLRLLVPDQLLARLDHALDTLRSGPRDSPQRQQTLRATIDWSHSLLTASEQRLFRRMGVFAGGCDLAAVERVCSDDGGGDGTLDDLESLVDHALVQADGDRLRMLETIREYAHERLVAAGEEDGTRARHARHYTALAADIRAGIEGTAQVDAITSGIVEEGNLQDALETLSRAAEAGDADARESGLRLCGDLWLYWHIRGKHLTARKVSSWFLDGATGSNAKATCHVTAGLASWTLGQYEQANEEYSEASRLAGEVGDERVRCIAAFMWGLGLLQFDIDLARQRTAEAIELGRAIGFPWGEGFAGAIDGILQTVAGDLELARTRYADALALQQRLGDHEGAGLSLGGLAALAAGRDETALALDLYAQSLAAFATIGDRAEEARILSEVAWTYLAHDDAAAARAHFLESVDAYAELASVRGVGLSLIGLAATEFVEGRPVIAVEMAAAAEGYAAAEGIVNVYSEENPGEAYVERARASLSAEEVELATEQGRRRTIAQAIGLSRGRPEITQTA
jgi:predicted ATPase/DNA-binding CsgD family transcriptional regulator